MFAVGAFSPLAAGASVDSNGGLARRFTESVAVASNATSEMNWIELAQDVPPVRREKPRTPPAGSEGQSSPSESSEADKPADDRGWSARDIGVVGRVQDWLARANRAFQNRVIKRLSVPPEGGTSDDEIARKLEEEKQQRARAAEARREEEARKAAAAREAADEAAERKKRQSADAARVKAREKAEAEARVREEADAAAKAKAAAAAAKAAKPQDDKSLADDLRKEREKLEAEAKRIEQEKKAADERRRAEQKAKAEARLAEKRKQEAERRSAEERDSTEQRRRTEEEQASRDRKRTVVITVEPIARPPPYVRDSRGRSSGVEAETQNEPPERSGRAQRVSTEGFTRGPAVRRWLWRSGNCRRAGHTIIPPGRYTVARGDTLWLISAKHYRNGGLYPRIYWANRGRIGNPNLIYPCERVFVPRRR